MDCKEIESLMSNNDKEGLSIEDHRAVEQHLTECSRCDISRGDDSDRQKCLNTEILANYAFDEGLSEDEVAIVEEHFAECVFCRSEVTLLREMQKDMIDMPVYPPK